MKVIDVLNMWANDENVKVRDEKGYFASIRKLMDNLNSEVEIIEDTPKEEKKIEKLGAFNIKKFYDDYPETAHFILEMFKKQEELIDKVNGE